MLGLKDSDLTTPNLHEFKRNKLAEFAGKKPERKIASVGMPLALGMFELLPLWHTIFTEIVFEVVVSEMSIRKTYLKGQNSIPSDTACYPAKLIHGHIEELIEKGVDSVFYPCISYNIDEHASSNHYNCPVVAYYSELLSGNVEELKNVKFMYPYLNINDKKQLTAGLHKCFKEHGYTVSKSTISKAVNKGFDAYEKYMADVRAEGERAIKYARENGKRILILAGRPYHTDSEIGHGIDKLCRSLGFAVVSEDSVWHLAKARPTVNVLNQWTYHSRLYNAAEFAVENDDAELVQLVSFGCGLDAVTTDEVKDILERNGKLYTQIKIDEITNLGAVKIRLRSLIGAIEERSAEN